MSKIIKKIKDKKQYTNNLFQLLEEGADPDYVCDMLDDDGSIIK